jgi:porphobilinogen deaminase
VAAHATILAGEPDNASNSLLQSRIVGDPSSTRGAAGSSNSLLQGNAVVRLLGLVASPDGREVVRVEAHGEPEEVGGRLAREALALGARDILERIRG